MEMICLDAMREGEYKGERSQKKRADKEIKETTIKVNVKRIRETGWPDKV